MSYARALDLRKSRPLAPEQLQPASNKLLGLELLRFAAALAVLFNHYRFFAQMPGMLAIERSSIPLYSLLWPLYNYGYLGVQIFWGISGYIFFWKYGAAIRAGAVSAREFFWLRFSRLYPLHLATLVAVVGLQAVYRSMAGSDFIYPAQDATLFVQHLFLASDWVSISFSFNGPIWSVSAEIAVYGAFYALLRNFAPSMGLCAAVVIAGLFLALAGVQWVMISCATYFFAGGLAALAPAAARRIAGPALLVLLLFLGALDPGNFAAKLPMILLVAGPCLLLVIAQEWRWLARWQRPVQLVGNLTYSSYLLHFPLQLLLAIAVGATGLVPNITGLAFFAAWLATTFTAAFACYRLFEMPAQRWIRQRTLDSACVRPPGRGNAYT